MKIQEKTEINAILGEEFNKVLTDLGVFEGVNLGEYKCQVCGDKMSFKNILLIFPLTEKMVGFICKKPSCLIKYREPLEK